MFQGELSLYNVISPGSAAEGFGREGGESRQGRATEEGEGGQEEEEEAEATGVGMRGGH